MLPSWHGKLTGDYSPCGIAIWPVRDAEREWKLELDIDSIGWKSFRNLNVNLSYRGTHAPVSTELAE